MTTSDADLTRPRRLLPAAVAIGLAAGLAAGVFFSILGEPLIDDAIAIEEERAAAEHPQDEGAPEVSRSVQRGWGLFGATLLGGAGFGLLAAVSFAGFRNQADPFRRALLAVGVLAGSFTVVPWLKYPPNPPAVGDPDTIDQRQLKWSLLVCLTALVLVGAAHLSGRLRDRGFPEHRRVVAVVATVVVALGLVLALFPPVTDPLDMPANLIWRFRLVSFGGNLLLWSVLALGLGTWAAGRATRSGRAAQNSMPLSAVMPES